MAIEEQYDSLHFLADSINILLQTIGELPITSLEDVDNILEAQIAQKVIFEAKQTILSEGWEVNTDVNYPFLPDTNGFIPVPPHCLEIKSGKNIILRDWQLYNKTTHSRIFDAPVSCSVTWNLGFETLPHALRYYITIYAARIFQARMISDKAMYNFTKEDESTALVRAKNSNGYLGEFNMLDSDHANTFNILS